MAEADILLVEDNPGDMKLVNLAFEERNLPGELHMVSTGEKALNWLFEQANYEEVPRPDLILLDLNLPGKSGHDVLKEVKDDTKLRLIPVVVLSGSQYTNDIVEAYDSHANAYVTKPDDPEVFADLIQNVIEFWISTVELPSFPDK